MHCRPHHSLILRTLPHSLFPPPLLSSMPFPFPLLPNCKYMSSTSWSAGEWSREEEKAFENGIAMYWSVGGDQRWRQIGCMVPSKSIQELKDHYQLLVEDVAAIEAGTVPLPNYNNAPVSQTDNDNNHNRRPSYTNSSNFSPLMSPDSAVSGGGQQSKGGGGGSSKSDQERRKGIPLDNVGWPCRLFLLGLDKFGKGDWRSISRNFVISRTPTQVASHAQKYFIRLNSISKERRRSSIHDITSVNGTTPTGDHHQQQHAHPTVKQHHHHQRPNNMNGLGMMYAGAPVGHPVTIHPGHHYPPSALGTPVILSPAQHNHHHHPPYVLPLACPMPPPPPPPPPTNQ